MTKNRESKSTLISYIDRIPIIPLAFFAIFMSLAPFSPEPHLVEKSRMLMNGELTRGIDIFDFFWHSFFPVLLVIRLWRRQKSAIKE